MVASPRAGVDESVVVEEHRGGAQVRASYPAAAPQDSQLHRRAPAAISRRTRSRRPIRPAGGFGASLQLPSRNARRNRIPDSLEEDLANSLPPDSYAGNRTTTRSLSTASL